MSRGGVRSSCRSCPCPRRVERASGGVLALAALVALAVGLPRAARADGPYEGTWREGPMRIRVDVDSWGGDCGPRPQSTRTEGGGTFRITQSGDQLTFQLRQPRTTRTCWSENRAVRRVSSTFQAGTWRVVCRTPQADSRAETGTYTIQALGEDRLQFRDVSEYDWQLNASRCQARIVTTQTFTRVASSEPAAPEPTAGPTPSRCTPGAPARVVLRPARADVQPGGEQCFTARVLDAEGCPVPRRAALTVARGAGRVDGRCYRAPETAGEATVLAQLGGLRATAEVSVHSMDLSDLIARRTETGSVGQGAPTEDASSETAARLTASGAEEAPKLWVGLAALAVAALLLVAGAVWLRRRRREASLVAPGPPGQEPTEDGGAAEEAPAPSASAGEGPPPEPDARPSAASLGSDMICPTCRRGYPPTARRCPHDDTALMPYQDFAAGRDESGKARENVCPVCGDRFGPNVRFCGKDGVALEPADSEAADSEAT